jgi:hypothetical protein
MSTKKKGFDTDVSVNQDVYSVTISLERDPRTVSWCIKDTEPGIKLED